jgi:hypothetical protein
MPILGRRSRSNGQQVVQIVQQILLSQFWARTQIVGVQFIEEAVAR